MISFYNINTNFSLISLPLPLTSNNLIFTQRSQQQKQQSEKQTTIFSDCYKRKKKVYEQLQIKIEHCMNIKQLIDGVIIAKKNYEITNCHMVFKRVFVKC